MERTNRLMLDAPGADHEAGTSGLSMARGLVRALSIRIAAGCNPNRDVSYYRSLSGAMVAVPGYAHTGLYRRGTTDRNLYRLTRSLVEDAVFLDVGASVGEFSLVAAVTAPRGRTYSFEPCPLIRSFLELNIRLNGLDHVTVVDKALSDRTQTLPLSFGTQTTASTVGTVPAAGERQLMVCAVQGDDFAAETGLERVDLMKIDVEGAELPVLAGCRALLASARPLLVVEVDGHSDAFGYGDQDLLHFLEAEGYVAREFRIDDRGFVELAPVTLPRTMRARRANPNIVAIPEDRAAARTEDGRASVTALWP